MLSQDQREYCSIRAEETLRYWILHKVVVVLRPTVRRSGGGSEDGR